MPEGSNTGELLLGTDEGGLGTWRFHSHECADRYFTEGPAAFRVEGMAVHPETNKGGWVGGCVRACMGVFGVGVGAVRACGGCSNY